MDRNLIEQVRHANDIVNVIQGYLPLKRAGANWRGICPFHQDTNPSLNVNPARQIFKCFACGKAGNVFTFVQEYEKLTFFEAFKKLAARAGIAIPDSDRTKTVSTKRDQLLQIYTAKTSSNTARRCSISSKNALSAPKLQNPSSSATPSPVKNLCSTTSSRKAIQSRC